LVGRFLEHSRIYYFRNNGEERIYSSAVPNLMPAKSQPEGLKLLFPIEDRIDDFAIFTTTCSARYLADNVQGA